MKKMLFATVCTMFFALLSCDKNEGEDDSQTFSENEYIVIESPKDDASRKVYVRVPKGRLAFIDFNENQKPDEGEYLKEDDHEEEIISLNFDFPADKTQLKIYGGFTECVIGIGHLYTSGKIDISQYPKLKKISGTYRTMIAEESSVLEELYVTGSQTSVPIEKFPNLKSLGMNDLNYRGTPNFSKNPLIEELSFSAQQVQSIDLSTIPKLKKLDLTMCLNLSTVNLSYSTDLEELYFSAAGISKLDVSKNKALKKITFGTNKFTANTLDAFINSIPKVSSGEIKYRDYNNVEEPVMTPKHIANLKAKGWVVVENN